MVAVTVGGITPLTQVHGMWLVITPREISLMLAETVGKADEQLVIRSLAEGESEQAADDVDRSSDGKDELLLSSCK